MMGDQEDVRIRMRRNGVIISPGTRNNLLNHLRNA
jgi:hypothetical protein